MHGGYVTRTGRQVLDFPIFLLFFSGLGCNYGPRVDEIQRYLCGIGPGLQSYPLSRYPPR